MKKFFLLYFALYISFVFLLFKIFLYINYSKTLEPNHYQMSEKYKLLMSLHQDTYNIIIGDSRSTYLNTKYISENSKKFFFNYSSGGNNNINVYYLIKRMIDDNLNIEHIYLQRLSNKHNSLKDIFYKKGLIYLLKESEKQEVYKNLHYSYFDIIKSEIELWNMQYLNISFIDYFFLFFHTFNNSILLNQYFYSDDNKFYGYSIYNFTDQKLNVVKNEDVKADNIFNYYYDKTITLLKDNNISYTIFNPPIFDNYLNSSNKQLVLNKNFSYDNEHIYFKYHHLYNEWFFKNILVK